MATAKLRILETTDLHMNLQGTSQPTRGLVHLAGHIAALRADGIPNLLFDNGDLLQGTPLADHLMSQAPEKIHPAVDALNELGYDAVALGNHEFNFPLWRTIAALAGFKMPVVCANVRCGNMAMLTTPWAMLTRDLPCSDGKTRALRIGVIGFVPPQIVNWDHTHLEGKVQTEDILAAAMTHTPAMKRAGADLIVALCHSGIGSATHSELMENAVVPLAALDAIDVVLTGHTHDVFPGTDIAATEFIDPDAGTVHGKPTVMAGFNGSHLGCIDIDLTHDPRAGWSLSGHKTRVIAAGSDGVQPDARLSSRLEATLAPAAVATEQYMAEPLASTASAMTSHFTMLGYDPTLWLLAEAQQQAAEPFLIQSAYANLPVAVAVSSFNAGGRAGPQNFLAIQKTICRRDVAAICPFDNSQCVVLQRGWQIRQWLERSAAIFRQIQPGQSAQPLLEPNFPTYSFDRLIGLDYGFDLSAKPASTDPASIATTGRGRVTHLRHLGRDIADDALVAVVTNSFRARSKGVAQVSPDDIVHTSTDNIATILTRHLMDRGQVQPHDAAQFSLSPVKGATATFDTHPSAKLPPDAYETRALGMTEAGFLRFQIAL